MTIVQHCTIWSTGANASVWHPATPSLTINFVEELGLQLILELAVADRAHDLHVGVACHIRTVSHDLYLGGGLGHPAMGQDGE